MGNRQDPARARNSRTPQRNGHIWQHPALQLRLRFSGRPFASESRSLPGSRLHRRPRAHWWDLFRRAERGRWGWSRMGYGTVFPCRSRTDHKISSTSSSSTRSSATNLVLGQGQCAGYVETLEKGCYGGDYKGIPTAEARASSD